MSLKEVGNLAKDSESWPIKVIIEKSVPATEMLLRMMHG